MSGAPKVVLVTGCSNGGIGFHLCLHFAKHGCKVYATSRRLESMDAFDHPSIRRLAMDVTSEEDVEAVVQQIIEAEGRIDVVVNNAGHACIGPTVEIPLETVKRTFDANVYGALRTAQAAFPHMAARKSGLIVNIGSVVGHIATPWAGIYCATKAALRSITESLYMEFKPFNIDVMLVAPAGIKSNFSSNHAQTFTLPEDSLYKDYLDRMLERMWASQGKGSMPTEEFAELVVRKALRRKPPAILEGMGAGGTLITILKWLPRTFALYLMCRALIRK
ncbi:oxidoreductase [Gloeophyllum trabeum ATCC 11539]|uniref:Oxidoreductase n=1 Tax=Gloeophyllum trabeum (strain ATCC 11539 / FP-39264 / Madison 617) TaxID=670483 RepID=S7S3F1_GLOTA|nr:oxidoreductase [Gloeophyllum trabeum ATCC 11539]EPQ60364.1 oxidoreductase [Gloeophyllum trabeum ATCC 11539]